MPLISRIQMMNQKAQPALIIRTRTTIEGLPKLIGESYFAIGNYLMELGESVSEVPYVAYYNTDMKDLDVEIGFPVLDELPGKDNIIPGEIPAGIRIFCMYRGPYSDMKSAYTQMQEWMSDKDYELNGAVYEQYYNDTEFPEKDYLTKIVMPIKKQ